MDDQLLSRVQPATCGHRTSRRSQLPCDKEHLCGQVTHSRAHVSRVSVDREKDTRADTQWEPPHMHNLWKPILMEGRKHLYDICILTSLPLVAHELTVPCAVGPRLHRVYCGHTRDTAAAHLKSVDWSSKVCDKDAW